MARPTISSTDVARAAGVSRTTVSYVLNGLHETRIPAETRQRVLDVARQLGYRGSTLARGLKSGRTSLVGVFTRLHEESFQNRIVHGIHRACYDLGYSVMIACFGDDQRIERENLMRMLDFKVHGIIRVVGGLTAEERAMFSVVQDADRVPVIVVDDKSSREQFDCVVSDDFAGARSAVEHLIALGHRRIAHISGGTAVSSSRDRIDGYWEALKTASIALDSDLLAGDAYTAHSGFLAAQSLLALASPPTAIFCANDIIASVAREAAREKGMQVPRDLAIVGYGDTELAVYSAITSVDQQPEQMGQIAVERLFARLDDTDCVPRSIVVPTTLIVRASTAAGAILPTPWRPTPSRT